MAKISPANTALRWEIAVSCRQYSVPRPNSLWHLHGHHFLIRWDLVIHGCIDGFSQRITFLRCNNNPSQTVSELFFLRAIENDALWPSRIQRVDYGVENVQVSDAMVEVRVESGWSFQVCSSTRNKILVGRFQVLCIGRHRLAQHCNEQP